MAFTLTQFAYLGPRRNAIVVDRMLLVLPQRLTPLCIEDGPPEHMMM